MPYFQIAQCVRTRIQFRRTALVFHDKSESGCFPTDSHNFILFYFFSIRNETGVNPKWLDQVLSTQSTSNVKYKTVLIDHLLQIINMAAQLSEYKTIIM